MVCLCLYAKEVVHFCVQGMFVSMHKEYTGVAVKTGCEGLGKNSVCVCVCVGGRCEGLEGLKINR